LARFEAVKPKPKAKPGRPTVLTPKLARAIVKSIRLGCYIEDAAEAEGVSRSVVFDWLDQGRRGVSEAHIEFLDAVTRARAADTRNSMATIEKASKLESGALEWKAAAWKLERKHPAKFGPKVRITVVEELSGFLEELARVIPAEWYEKVLEVAARRSGGDQAGGPPSIEAEAFHALPGGVPDQDSGAGQEGVRAAPSPETAP
jgi:hypothetical protein